MSAEKEQQLADLAGCLQSDLVDILDLAEGSDDPALVARCLVVLRDLKQDAATTFDDVERHLLACMGERTIEVEGLGLVESHPKIKRSGWQWDDLMKIAKADLPFTIRPADADTVISAVRAIVGFSSGKVTRIRELGDRKSVV